MNESNKFNITPATVFGYAMFVAGMIFGSLIGINAAGQHVTSEYEKKIAVYERTILKHENTISNYEKRLEECLRENDHSPD